MIIYQYTLHPTLFIAWQSLSKHPKHNSPNSWILLDWRLFGTTFAYPLPSADIQYDKNEIHIYTCWTAVYLHKTVHSSASRCVHCVYNYSNRMGVLLQTAIGRPCKRSSRNWRSLVCRLHFLTCAPGIKLPVVIFRCIFLFSHNVWDSGISSDQLLPLLTSKPKTSLDHLLPIRYYSLHATLLENYFTRVCTSKSENELIKCKK